MALRKQLRQPCVWALRRHSIILAGVQDHLHILAASSTEWPYPELGSLLSPQQTLLLCTGRPYVAKAETSDDSYEAEASTLSPGQRCCVDPGQRRGEIK